MPAFTLALWLALGAVPPAPAQPAPDAELAPAPAPATKREARRILKAPRGSLSFGLTNSGRLDRASELPLEGKGYEVYPGFVPRDTNWGTRELVGLIQRATEAVATKHRGSVLGVGNLSKREGGQTGHSVSHKAGRDVDLGMYATGRGGKRVQRTPFVKFGEDLKARGGRVSFDVERNTALMIALLSDDKAPVQFVFVAHWLKQAMLTFAREHGVDPAMITRMDEVLHQPSDSNPHQDHFHVRIYCSVQDRLHGCLERGPLREWVDLGDAQHAARVADLMRVARMNHKRYRRRALVALGQIRAYAAVPLLVATLDHADGRSRALALSALRAIGSPAAVPGILLLLKRTARADRARELLDALPSLGVPEPAVVARGVLAHPGAHLHPTLAADPPPEVVTEAIDQLAIYGRKPAALLLLAYLDSPQRGVREAAHRALTRVTNQIVRGRIGSGRARLRKKVVDAWGAFFEAHGADDWLAWIKLGLERRGVRLPEGPLDLRAVPALIDAVRHRDRVAGDNAVHALSALTGHPVDPRWRSPKNNQRHWRSWWRANQPAQTPTATP